MDDKQSRILQLLAKFENKEASETERNELDEWYQSFDEHPKFTTDLTTEQQINARENLLNKINARLDSQLASKHTIIPVKTISVWPKIAAAAAILVFFVVNRLLLLAKS